MNNFQLLKTRMAQNATALELISKAENLTTGTLLEALQNVADEMLTTEKESILSQLPSEEDEDN